MWRGEGPFLRLAFGSPVQAEIPGSGAKTTCEVKIDVVQVVSEDERPRMNGRDSFISDAKEKIMAETDLQSPVKDEQKLVNKQKIAHRYDVSQRTIQDWMETKDFPFHKIGYMVRFNPEECDRALDRFKK